MTIDANNSLKASIMSQVSTKTKIMITGRTAKGANFWLTTPLNTWNQSVIEPKSFRCLLKCYLGIALVDDSLGPNVPEIDESKKRCPECHLVKDIYGHHAFSCLKNNSKIAQHNSVVRGIFDYAHKSGVPCLMEQSNPMKNTKQRPGDCMF